METSNCTCTKCRQTKPFNEFLRLGVKGSIKQFRTCNDCHNKMAECQEVKKRQLEINENEDQENEDQENGSGSLHRHPLHRQDTSPTTHGVTFNLHTIK